MSEVCSNCTYEARGNFCSNCGQPVLLKRIDGQYIKHEIEHLLHLEKGILYTIKELLIRPGKSVAAFLDENRNRLVKPIIFIIITSLIYTIITNYFKIEEQYVSYRGLENTAIETILRWVQQHYGYANIMMGIIIAAFLRLFFKKSGYNIYELVVLLCFVMGIGMLIFAFFSLLQGLFDVNLMQWSGRVGVCYAIFAIADFFGKRRFTNYLKSLASYMLGMLCFYIIAVLIGIFTELILR